MVFWCATSSFSVLIFCMLWTYLCLHAFSIVCIAKVMPHLNHQHWMTSCRGSRQSWPFPHPFPHPLPFDPQCHSHAPSHTQPYPMPFLTSLSTSFPTSIPAPSHAPLMPYPMWRDNLLCGSTIVKCSMCVCITSFTFSLVSGQMSWASNWQIQAKIHILLFIFCFLFLFCFLILWDKLLLVMF